MLVGLLRDEVVSLWRTVGDDVRVVVLGGLTSDGDGDLVRCGDRSG